MPTWPELQDFETQLDVALAAVLAPFATAPYSFQLCGETNTVRKDTPRLDFTIDLVAPAGPGNTVQQRPGLARPASLRPMARGFAFSIHTVYDPTKTNLATLGFRGALRERLAAPTAAFDATSLPWLELLTLTEVTAARDRYKDQEVEKDLWSWSTRWEGVLAIRPSALPDT